MKTTKMLAAAALFALSGLAGACCHGHHCDANGMNAHHGVCERCRANTQSVALSEVPAPVQATFEREAAGGKIEDVARHTMGGQSTYSAEVMINGDEFDVTVAENGMILSKER